MAKFITLTRDAGGGKFQLNIDHILSIFPGEPGDSSMIYLANDERTAYRVKETFKEISDMVNDELEHTLDPRPESLLRHDVEYVIESRTTPPPSPVGLVAVVCCVVALLIWAFSG